MESTHPFDRERALAEFSVSYAEIPLLKTSTDPYFMMGNIDELGLTGGEVFNVKSDDGFQHISTFTREQIMAMNRERFVSVIDVQQVMYFIIPLD